LARGVLRAVAMVGVLSVAARCPQTSVSVLLFAAFGAVVPVCVWWWYATANSALKRTGRTLAVFILI